MKKRDILLFCILLIAFLIGVIFFVVYVGKGIAEAQGSDMPYSWDGGSYSFYSSTGENFTEDNGKLISTGNGEQKAIYSEDIGHQFDISFTVAVADNASAINGGLYFMASEATDTEKGYHCLQFAN